MAKTIVIVGTLDTKGEELGYVKELIERRGHETTVIDGGILGQPLFLPDVGHEQVAQAAGYCTGCGIPIDKSKDDP